MTEPINIFLGEDQYFGLVLVQLVTKTGQYYNKSIAHRDLAAGRVFVNGTCVKKPEVVYPPGIYTISVGPNSYSIKLFHSAFE